MQEKSSLPNSEISIMAQYSQSVLSDIVELEPCCGSVKTEFFVIYISGAQTFSLACRISGAGPVYGPDPSQGHYPNCASMPPQPCTTDVVCRATPSGPLGSPWVQTLSHRGVAINAALLPDFLTCGGAQLAGCHSSVDQIWPMGRGLNTPDLRECSFACICKTTKM